MRSTTLDEILKRLHQTERELEQELDRLLVEKREQFQYQLKRGRVVFQQGIKTVQRKYRTRSWAYIVAAPITFVLSAPLIYGMIIPFALLDVCVTIYQHICFRIYRIPLVRRADYLVIDRHHLAYLNTIEKINCIYCGYGNGLIEYVREVSARTEQFWCPIKHARRTLDAHQRVNRFVDYGDAESYRGNLAALRRDWKEDTK